MGAWGWKGNLERNPEHTAKEADGPSVHAQRNETVTQATAWMDPEGFMKRAGHKKNKH